MGFLIDTCVWIDVERGNLAPADVAEMTRNEEVYLSPVTLAELRFGIEVARSAAEKQRRLAAYRRLERKPILPIDGTTGEIFGSLAAAVRTSGSGHRYRTQDIWLASQAIQHGFGFLTRNQKDFDDLPGLSLVSYHLS